MIRMGTRDQLKLSYPLLWNYVDKMIYFSRARILLKSCKSPNSLGQIKTKLEKLHLHQAILRQQVLDKHKSCPSFWPGKIEWLARTSWNRKGTKNAKHIYKCGVKQTKTKWIAHQHQQQCQHKLTIVCQS